MAHEIFGERFYGHRTPAWHNLGFVTQEGLTAQEALAGLGGGYWFDKVPNQVEEDGVLIFAGDYKIRRSPTPDDAQYRYFGNVTDRYNILQPLEISEMFDKYVGEPVETFGMLGKGERLFITWVLNNYTVNGFSHTMNAFLAVGYDAKYGATLNVVDTRVVCSNTWRMAIAEVERKYKSKEGYGRVWTGKHNSPNIKRDLGIWMQHVQDQAERDAEFIQQQMEKLAETKVSKDEFYNLLFGIYPNPKPLPQNYPVKLRAEKQERIDTLTEYAQRDRDLVMDLFSGGYGTGINGENLYDGFNSVTEYEDWGRMTKKSADLSIVMGNRSNTKQRAMSLFYEYATVEG